MDNSMLGKVLKLIMTVPASWLGTLCDLLERLTSENGAAWFEALKQFLRKGLETKKQNLIKLFSIKKTNLFVALKEAEDFDKGASSIGANLSWMFALPKTLPWEKVIAIYIRANTDYLDCMRKMEVAGKGIQFFEGSEIFKKFNDSSSSNQHRLFLIERSELPTINTMGMSPDQLLDTKRTFIGLGAYAIAMAQYYEMTGKHLDPETFTWFPNDQLRSGLVPGGYYHPGTGKVGFRSNYLNGFSPALAGAREVIEVPLKSYRS